MKVTKPGNHLYGIIGVLIGSLISMVIMVVGPMREIPSRNEVLKMISEFSPYSKDQKAIQQSIENLEESIGRLNDEITRLRDSIDKLKTK